MASTKRDVHVRRIYDEVDVGGARVLVDRLWPRGVSKDDADLTAWPKEVAPSDELRTWYGHDPDRFDEFVDRYRAELDDDAEHQGALDEVVALAKQGGVVLLTATKDVEHSHAPVLASVVRDRLNG